MLASLFYGEILVGFDVEWAVIASFGAVIATIGGRLFRLQLVLGEFVLGLDGCLAKDFYCVGVAAEAVDRAGVDGEVFVCLYALWRGEDVFAEGNDLHCAAVLRVAVVSLDAL